MMICDTEINVTAHLLALALVYACGCLVRVEIRCQAVNTPLTVCRCSQLLTVRSIHSGNLRGEVG